MQYLWGLGVREIESSSRDRDKIFGRRGREMGRESGRR